MGRIDFIKKYKGMGLTQNRMERIIEWYSTGRDEDKIRSYFGINQETLKDIVEYYGGNSIETIRKEHLNKWKDMAKLESSMNPMGLPKKRQSKKDNPNPSGLSREERIKNLAKAIRNVERAKEGDER